MPLNPSANFLFSFLPSPSSVLCTMVPPNPPLLLYHMSLSLLLLLFLLVSKQASSASNSISLNQTLSGKQKLVSEGSSFVLGFFQPGNSSYYYIGIWYNRISQLTPVWVANRDAPITEPTAAELKICSDGNLVLLDQSNSRVWSTDANITSNNTVAVLLDAGNFVLKDASNPNKTLWQSYDHPTDTWLPGGKLGVNKFTGQIQHLTSWKSLDDPSPGIYSLGIDPNGSSQYFTVWNNSVNYWSSGIWNGEIFTAVPEMMSHYLYSFQYVSSDTERYFTYTVQSSVIITRFVMGISGQIQQLTWVENSQEWILLWSQPKQQCQVFALCGPYGSCNENAYPFCTCIEGFREQSPADWALGDRTRGCVRKTKLQCGKNNSSRQKKDRFFTMSNVRFPDNMQTFQVGCASKCELACLNNCYCNAYSFSGRACSLWYGDLLNLQEKYTGPSGGTLFLRLSASEFRSPRKEKRVVIIEIACGIIGTSALLAIIYLLVWTRKRKGMMGIPERVEGGLIAFRYNDLQRMSKNFSEKLGEGGFGSVFKGVMRDSKVIAIKKLERISQGEKQFRSEVSTIGIVQHSNLVRLHGFCSEGNNRLLVYEYMPNGSLNTQLFHNNPNDVLNWKRRYQIALGIARGLTYLHDHCRDCIIHCDIKPENVLLDASFVPKLADFGLAKLLGRDASRVLTTMRGTIGYLAPEWISGSAITAKADVYSYGMMLFEIISGRRNFEQTDDQKPRFFPTLAARKLVDGDVIGILDQRLEGDAKLEEVIRACKVAVWCIQDDEKCRPTMGQVVQILEEVLEVNLPPIPQALQMFDENLGTVVFFSELSLNRSSEIKETSSSSEIRSLL